MPLSLYNFTIIFDAIKVFRLEMRQGHNAALPSTYPANAPALKFLPCLFHENTHNVIKILLQKHVNVANYFNTLFLMCTIVKLYFSII